MPNIDNDTLLVSIQSVYQSIKRYESLLSSETLKDPENIEELLLSYDEALETHKSCYEEQLELGANLPPLESILYSE